MPGHTATSRKSACLSVSTFYCFLSSVIIIIVVNNNNIMINAFEWNVVEIYIEVWHWRKFVHGNEESIRRC